MPQLTIAYLTFRTDPRFEWFVSSLKRELRDTGFAPSELQIIVVDGKYGARPIGLGGLPAKDVVYVPPKPTVWQGPHRLTKRDYFCAANTRNTAFALARSKHIAFVDDLSVLLPGWLSTHLRAAEEGYLLCGTTCKHKNIVVNDSGDVVSSEEFPPGTDSRLKHIGEGRQRCTGWWVYGGTFSVPLEAALAVNGQDEIHDSIGGEDYDFGERVERVGTPIYIDKSCGTLEDEDAHNTQEPMIRLDKPWPGPDGPYSSNLLLNRLQREQDRIWTIGNPYHLREVRATVLEGQPFPIMNEPSRHWVDDQPLSEM